MHQFISTINTKNSERDILDDYGIELTLITNQETKNNRNNDTSHDNIPKKQYSIFQ